MSQQIEFSRTALNDGKILCLYGGKKNAKLRGQWLPSPERKIKVLNYSGGKQSTLLLWLAILGEIERPDVVMSANPGMEGQKVLDSVAAMQEEARKAGIPAYTVPGPNLFEAIVGLKRSGRTRFDTPAFYTKGPNGTREGKLTQRCTKWAKIAPMNRACRIELEARLGISRKSSHLPVGVVEKWIGFSSSEVHRIKPPVERWTCFRYPLVDLGMSNGDVIKWFQKQGKPVPERSVCRGCFANDASFFRHMYETDPEGWRQAVEVDEAIRDWKQIGVREPVYILRSCISLLELQERGFVDLPSGESCDSGYCMT